MEQRMPDLHSETTEINLAEHQDSTGGVWFGLDRRVIELLSDPELRNRGFQSKDIHASVVKQSKMRIVYRLETAYGNFFFKQSFNRGPRNMIKLLWRRKAEEEFKIFLAMHADGISTVDYIAYGKHGIQDFLISRELPDAIECSEKEGEIQDVEAWARAYADFLKTLVVAGYHHPDMHAGNAMITGDMKFHLVDLDRIKKHPQLSTKQILDNIFSLYSSLKGLRHKTQCEILAPFAEICECSPEDFTSALYRYLQRKFLKHFFKRGKKFKKDSSIVTPLKSSAGTWLVRRNSGLTASQIDDTITQHCQFQENRRRPGWLKTDTKRCISRCTVGERSIILKEYRLSRPRLFSGPGISSWMNANGLSTFGVPHAHYFGICKRDAETSLILMEDVGENHLTDLMKAETSPAVRKQLMFKAGKLLGLMHALRIVHKDMKADNIVFNAQDEAIVIDLDKIRFFFQYFIRPAFRRAFREMLGTLPQTLTKLEAMAAFSGYCDGAGIHNQQKVAYLGDFKSIFNKQVNTNS